MAEKRMTKRDNYNTLLTIKEVAENPALTAFIQHEIELLDKKGATEKKPTAKQTENADIKTEILNGMEDGKKYTIAELQDSIGVLADLTNQRISALLKQMKDANLIVRTEDKRKAYFSKA